MLMHRLLDQGAERNPDKVAFRWVDRNTALSYGEAVHLRDRFAGALHHLDVRSGDRVTIFADNGMDYLVGLFACWRIGAIAALVNLRFEAELADYLRDHESNLLIYTHEKSEAVRQAVKSVPSIRATVCMDGPQAGAESLPDLLDASFPPPPDTTDETLIAHLSYTSGTSGKPKGACLMHGPTMRATNCIAERLRITSDDVSFGPTALSSSYQLVGNILPPLHRGATVNVMSHWSAADGWLALKETGATILVANPTILSDLAEESRRRSAMPDRLRLGLSGGGPVPKQLKKTWRDAWRLPLVESYGQSELGGFVALGLPGLVPDAKLGAIGPATPDKEVAILDADGLPVALGEIGELCLRGGFMWGYWGQPEKSSQTLRGGWLHTGDAGVMDRDGYITLRGRFSELFAVSGRTWFPRDVEEVLTDVPGIRGAAVVGLPDARLGRRPVAYVVTDVSVDVAQVKASIYDKVSYDLSPLEIRQIDRFPMTPTGKIAKAELAALSV